MATKSCKVYSNSLGTVSCVVTYTTTTYDTYVRVKIDSVKVTFGSDCTSDDYVGVGFSFEYSNRKKYLYFGRFDRSNGDTQTLPGGTIDYEDFDRLDNSYTVTINVYRFDSTSGMGVVYPGGDYTFSVSVPAIVHTYTISYNANGGSGAPSSQTKTENVALTLSSTRPTRTNYQFWHWNTNASNTGASYNPGASYTANSAATLYAIWNAAVSFNANGGSGAPSTRYKTYGQSLTLPVAKPTRSGYVFARWNTKSDGTGTSYAPGGSYATDSPVTLYAVWERDVNKPVISSLTVVRTDSSGTQQSEGTYCKVTATWSVDSTYPSGNTGTVTGSIKPSGGSARSFSFSSGASGTSGTAVAIVANVDTDTQYTVTVTVTDSYPSVTSRSEILSRAKFVWDIRSGGLAMGIGSAAPPSGLEVGWVAQFDETVTLLKPLAKSAGEFDADLSLSYSCRTNQSLVTLVMTGIKPALALASGESVRVGTLPAGYRPPSTVYFPCYSDTSALCGKVWVQIASTGVVTAYNRSDATWATSQTVAATATYIV